MGLPTAKIQQMIADAIAVAISEIPPGASAWWAPIFAAEGEQVVGFNSGAQFEPFVIPAGVDVAYPFVLQVRAALIDSDKVSHTKVVTVEGIVARDGAGDVAVVEQDLALNAGPGDLVVNEITVNPSTLQVSVTNLNGSFGARFLYRAVLGPAISTTA